MTDADLATPGTGSLHRAAADHFATGVAVVTSRDAVGAVAARLVTSLTSLSLEPPALLLAVTTGSALQVAVEESGVLAISLLREDQDLIAQRVAEEGDAAVALRDISGSSDLHGLTVLTDCLTTMECVVTDSVEWSGDHLYTCLVQAARTSPGSPLVQYRGVPGRYQAFQEASDYANFRRLVLERAGSKDALLVVDEFAGTLGMEPASVHDALVRLQDEGLVRVNPADGSHVIVAIDDTGTSQALEARLLMELAATVFLGDALTPSQLDDLEGRREECSASSRGPGAEVDHDAHLRLHEYLVTLTDNSLLVSAFRNFTIPSATWNVIPRAVQADIEHDHRQLVACYRAGDIAAAQKVLRAHRDRIENVLSAAGPGTALDERTEKK